MTAVEGSTGLRTGDGAWMSESVGGESTPDFFVVSSSVMSADALGARAGACASGWVSLETCSMATSNKERASSYNASRIGKKSFSPSALREDPSLVISDVLQKWRREW